MKPYIIAHRANLEGPDPKTENTLESIQKCIEAKVDIELDIWYQDGKFFLGHDEPKLEFDPFTYNFGDSYIWFHCKSIKTMNELTIDSFFEGQNYRNQYNFFFHDKDDMTLTSKGDFWTYPGKELTVRSIAVMPEYISFFYESEVLKRLSENKLKGICSDYPLEWVEKLENNKVYSEWR